MYGFQVVIDRHAASGLNRVHAEQFRAPFVEMIDIVHSIPIPHPDDAHVGERDRNAFVLGLEGRHFANMRKDWFAERCGMIGQLKKNVCKGDRHAMVLPKEP